MTPKNIKDDLQGLIEETTTILGSTDQTYVQFLQLLQKNGQLSMPNRLLQGQMVFFKYSPVSQSFVSRNTYYDTFPLVLVTEVYKGGFEGINVHFVDYDFREFLFDAIMRDLPTIKAGQSWRNRILLDFDRLAARRKFRAFRPCYRKYLWKGMKRRPAVVPFELWEDMVKANIGRFIGAKPPTVHRESRIKILRGKL